MGISKKGSFGFRKSLNKVKVFKSTVPLKIANDARNHFLQGFTKGGGQTNASIGGWRRRKTPRTSRGRNASNGRAILVKTGAMRSDLKVRNSSFRKINIGIRSVNYAEFHNEGTGNMPQREIIGDSRVLERKIQLRLEKELNKIFN